MESFSGSTEIEIAHQHQIVDHLTTLLISNSKKLKAILENKHHSDIEKTLEKKETISLSSFKSRRHRYCLSDTKHVWSFVFRVLMIFVERPGL